MEEMQMLQWLCGATAKDKIKNKNIRGCLGIFPIQDKWWEVCLSGLGTSRGEAA